MKEEIINRIIILMMDKLPDIQLRELKEQIYIILEPYQIETKKNELILYDNTDRVLLQKYLEAKLAAGKSKETVRQYKYMLQLAMDTINKTIKTITEDDIRKFLHRYQKERKVNKTSLRNMRAYLSSFFGWLRKNRYITENPMDLVDTVKAEITIKEPYGDEELVRLRDCCEDVRDLALIDFLNASMVRVSEAQKLNITDLDFTERECIVYGKGRNENALFVSKRGGHRLSISGMQNSIKKVGNAASVEKVHAHRFRRTGATRCYMPG